MTEHGSGAVAGVSRAPGSTPAHSYRAPSRAGPPRLVVVLAVLGSVGISGGCASTETSSSSRALAVPGGVASVANAVAAAASACDLALVSSRADEKTGSARIVLMGDWRVPRPESALVEVRLEPSPDGTAVQIESHALAEYGMKAPDAEGGEGGCTPCAHARGKAGFVQYSRGLAMGNAIRATRCLVEVLEGKSAER